MLKELVGPGLRSWVKVLDGAFRDRPEVQVGPKVEAGAKEVELGSEVSAGTLWNHRLQM